MTSGKHIVILCSRLDLPGGIERAVVNTANLFAEKGNKTTILVLDETINCFYPVHPAVKLLQLPLSFGITPDGNVISRKIKLLTDVLKLRRQLKQIHPSLIIASEYPLAAAAILCGAKKYATVVSWEHHHFYELKRNLFWNRVYALTYPRLHAVVCLNADEQQLFQHVNTNPVVIPNFIEPGVTSSVENKLLLTVGRLTAVKGTDRLLKIAKSILTQHPDWQWKLIGDGDMKDDVLQFIEQEGLQNKLLVQAPVSHDISHEYQQASLYVMTSRNECFPMTLLEAQAAGLPCIAFDCDTGPRHIIRHNENGLLIDNGNIVAITAAISSLITDQEKRKQFAASSKENSQQFSKEKIYGLWNKYFIADDAEQ